MFQACNLVHVFTMEFINYLICSIFSFKIFSECLRRQEMALYKRDLVCSMILISENATPKTLHMEMNLWCNCKKQEYQVFHSITRSDLQHQHNQCECWSITKERHFQANIKHLTLYLPFGCVHVKLSLIPKLLEIPNLS